MGTFTGSPAEYDIMKIPGTASMRPPMFNFAKQFGEYLKSLIGQAAPSYSEAGGSIDPGMSPSMQALGVLSQMYANSPLPAVFGQAHGSMSRFANPSFTNPMARMQGGMPNYFPSDPNQVLPGGQKVGQLFAGGGGMTPFANMMPRNPAPQGPMAPGQGGGFPGWGGSGGMDQGKGRDISGILGAAQGRPSMHQFPQEDGGVMNMPNVYR